MSNIKSSEISNKVISNCKSILKFIFKPTSVKWRLYTYIRNCVLAPSDTYKLVNK